MSTILLTLDETDASHFAAAKATSLFGPEATYLSLHVEPVVSPTRTLWGPIHGYPFPTMAPGQLEDSAQRRELIESARAIAAEQTGEAGVTATPLGEAGEPSSAILRVAREHDVDVIVVGDHPRSWFRKLLDGSVADDLVDRAALPVLVIPLPDDDAEN